MWTQSLNSYRRMGLDKENLQVDLVLIADNSVEADE